MSVGCIENNVQIITVSCYTLHVLSLAFFFLLIFLLSTYELNKYAINECIVKATRELIALDP